MKINQAFTILSNAGGVRAARIITENNPVLSRWQVWKIARKLHQGVPVAKIIGQKWFYGLCFFTNKHTLDPRPDTETLVMAVLADCSSNIKTPNILDLGTGTGCVIISLIKNIHGACGTALDVSRRALNVARKNINNYGLERNIELRRGSFYDSDNKFKEKFDIIVSNPPYIAYDDGRVDIGAKHDPKIALYAPDNGFAAYDAIAKNAKKWIRDGGKIYLEIGVGMKKRVCEIFNRAGWTFVRAEKDLAGVVRVLVFC